MIPIEDSQHEGNRTRRSLWRRKRMLFLFLIVCIAPVVYLNETLLPVYEAKATVLLEPVEESVHSLDFLAQPMAGTYISNQIEEIRSRTLAAETVEKLDRRTRASLLAGAPLFRGPDEEREWLIRKVQRGVTAKPVRDSDVIRLRVTGPDPAACVDLANTLVDVLGERNIAVKKEEVSTVRRFIGDQLESVRLRLKDSEERLNKYKEESRLLTLDKESEALLDRVTNVEIEFNQVSTERGALKKELQAIREEMGRQKLQLGPSVTDVTSPWVQELKNNLVALEVRYTTLQVEGYEERHPQMMKLAEQIETTKQDLRTEILKMTEEEKLVDPLARMQDLHVQALSLDIQLHATKAKEDALRGILDGYDKELEALPGKELVLARLIRDKTVNERIYMMLLEKHEEARIAEAGKIGSIRVIDPAHAGADPIRPRKALNLLLAGMIALGASAAVCLFLDSRDRTICTIRDARSVGAAPVLGVIPDIRVNSRRRSPYGLRRGKRPEPEIRTKLLAISAPGTPSGESYRTLRTNLLYRDESESAKAFVITSPQPGEGKTTTTVNLGIAMSRAGMRTVIVESDLRKPRIHQALGVASDPGLSDFLMGTCPILDVVHPTECRYLWVVPVGMRVTHPSELLVLPAMDFLIRTLKEKYDAVLFDSPPSLLITDAALLARKTDGVLLVVRSGVTTTGGLAETHNMFRNVHVSIVGTVLNEASPPEISGHKYYGYYETERASSSPEKNDGDVAGAELDSVLSRRRI